MSNVELQYSLQRVALFQGNSLSPFLQVFVDVRLDPRHPQNTDVRSVELFEIKGMLSVSASNNDSNWVELGMAESRSSYNGIYANAGEVQLELRFSLPPEMLSKIERLRNGKDLFFRFGAGWMYSLANILRGNGKTTDFVILKTSAYVYKYPRSEWIDDLNHTEFDKIDLIELPKIDFPQIPLTSDVMKFVHEAEKATKEGNWDNVLGECRKALDALYNGIDEWGAKQTLTSEENEKIQKQSGNDKVKTRRNIYISRLVDHPEKSDRLNALRNSLFQFLSLDPHEAEYKGLHFSRSDALFASRTTISIIYTILSYLAQHQSKT